MSEDIDDIQDEEDEEDMGAVTLMLGLYLIILAFFILLNAISESSEEKFEKASQSLAEGFGFQLSGPVNMRDDVDVTINPVFDIIAREIQNVMESYVSVRNYKLSSNADQMTLRIDTSEVFSPGSIRIRPAMADFFEDLARVASSKRPGTEMVSQVTVTLDDGDRGASQLSLRELAARRSALFVRALIERGVKPHLVSAAARKPAEGQRSEIQIYFKVIITDAKEAKREARPTARSASEQGLGPRTPEPYPPVR